MVSRAQVSRIEKAIEQLAVERGKRVTFVPIYDGETTDQAIAEYDREPGNSPRQPHVVFNVTPGSRARAVESGLHMFAKLSPFDLSSLLNSIDGRCRGIPTPQHRRNGR